MVNVPQHVRPAKRPRLEKSDTKLLGNDTDPAYMDLPKIEDTRNGGARMHPLLRQGSRRCCLKEKEALVAGASINEQEESGLILIRCIGSQGCHQTWASPRNRQRVLGHLARCTYIDAKLRQKCNEELGTKAIGPVAETKTNKIFALETNGMEVAPSNKKLTRKDKGSLKAVVVNESRKKQKEKGDYHLMKCIVCCGIPPKVVDSAEWKEMMAALNPYYQPPSSTTLTEKLIVNEAAKITTAITKLLSGCRNLTITFDGGKIRRPKSTYSVHVTTATHHAFCVELDDASQLSHTAKYIFELLERVSTICFLWF